MTASEQLTCTQLYEADANFKGLVDLWVSERRCPVPLVDLCLEFGLERAADCCRWASSVPDKRVFSTAEEKRSDCGPYPCIDPGGKAYWYRGTGDHFADHLSGANAPPSPKYFNSIEDAILWLMDNWIPSKEQL